MTSTTFSSKSFPALYKWSVKRNRLIMLVFTVLMLLGLVIDLYVMSRMSSGDYGALPHDDLMEEYTQVGFASIIIAQCGAMVFTLISALHTFSFLHNKRSVDMFGSVPTTRGTLYISHLLGGITSVAAPFLIGCLLVMGITLRDVYYLSSELVMIAFGLIGIIAAYTLTAMLTYCCGTTADALLITIGFNGIYAGTVCLFWALISETIPGLVFEEIFSSPLITLFTPYAFCVFTDYYLMSEFNTAVVVLLIWSVVFTAAAFFAGLYLAKKHKAEVAQNEFAVKWVPNAVKIGGSVVFGLFAGFGAAMEENSGFGTMFTFGMWYLIIGFAVFFILHVILSRGFKREGFARPVIAYGCTTIAVLAIVFGFTTGMGIDKYVPSASNVKSVRMGQYEYSSPENIKTITEIHKVITDGIRTEYDYPYYIGANSYRVTHYSSFYDYDYTYSDTPDEAAERANRIKEFQESYPLTLVSDFSFDYKKKVGFSSYRSYYLYSEQMDSYDMDKIESLLQKLYNSEEFKRLSKKAVFDKSFRDLLNVTATPVLERYVYIPEEYKTFDDYGNLQNGYQSLGYVNLTRDKTFLNGFYEAYAKDALADDQFYKTFYMSGYEKAYGDEYLTLEVRYTGVNVRDMFYSYTSFSNDVYCVIPSYYTNTLKYLEYNDIPTDFGGLDVSYYAPDPSEYIEGSATARDYYINFGMTGNYSDLEKCTEALVPQLELTSIMRTNVTDDFSSWKEAHDKEFTEAVKKKTKELYDKHTATDDYIVEGYSNMITDSYVGESGDYFYLADQIIIDLDTACNDIVKSMSDKAV